MKEKKNLYILFVSGFFVLLVGVMGFMRNPDFGDMAMIFSGFALVAVSGYKLFIK